MNHLLHCFAAQYWRGKRRGQNFDPSPSKQPTDHPWLPIAGLRRNEDYRVLECETSSESTQHGGLWGGWLWSSGLPTFSLPIEIGQNPGPSCQQHKAWLFWGPGAKGLGFTSRCPRDNHLFSIRGAGFPPLPTLTLQTCFHPPSLKWHREDLETPMSLRQKPNQAGLKYSLSSQEILALTLVLAKSRW